jgi:teichuronic acid exporter
MVRWVAQLISWASTLVLVRVLSPEDYGIVGLAAAVAAWVGVLAELGLGSSTLTASELTTSKLARLNTVALLGGLLSAIVLSTLSLPAARLFGAPAVTGVLLVFALCIGVDALRVIPGALLGRRLDYKRLASIDLAKSIAQTCIVLTLALMGLGYWSLAVGQLVGSLIATALSIRSAPVGFSFKLSGEPGTELIRARMFLGGALSWQTYRNADVWMLGRFSGIADVGAFNLARNLVSMPTDKIVSIITSVTPGYFVSARDDKPKLKRLFLALSEVVYLVVIMPLVGLMLTADLAIPLLFGATWSASVTPIRYMCVSTMIWASSMLAGQVANLEGGLKSTTRAGILAAVASLPMYFFAARSFGGSGAAAAGIVIVSIVAYPSVKHALVTCNATWFEYASSAALAVKASVAMTIAVFLVRFGLGPVTGPTNEFVLSVFTGIAVCLVFVWRSDSEQVRNLRQAVQRKLKIGR